MLAVQAIRFVFLQNFVNGVPHLFLGCGACLQMLKGVIDNATGVCCLHFESVEFYFSTGPPAVASNSLLHEIR